MYWSWQVLHADCIVYDSIITPHAFPTGWLINAIDYLQHWWQVGIIALLYSKLFVFQCACVCVCMHTRTHACKRSGIHRQPWISTMGGEGGISQKGKKRKLRTQWRLWPFKYCFRYTKNNHFLRLPDITTLQLFTHYFTLKYFTICTNYMPGTFFPHQLYARYIFFFPTCTGKLTKKKSVISSVLISVQEGKRGVSLSQER